MSKSQYLLTSVQKSLKILDILSQSEDMTLTEISEKTGYDSTSIYRMLYTLEHEHFVEKTTKSTYHLSVKFITYGEKLKMQYSIANLVKQDMAELTDAIGMTTYLGTLTNDGKVAFIHREDSMIGVQVSVPAGHSTKAINSALGKIQIAFLDDKHQKQYLKNFSDILDSQQMLQLEEELSEAKENGYAIDCDERFKGFGSIAVPVFNDQNVCVGAIGVVTVASQVNALKDEVLPQMQECIKNIQPKLENKKFY